MRNEYRIGTLGLLLLLALAPFIHAIADPASESESGGPVTTTETRPESSNGVPNRKPAEVSREEAPADPFVPSETISADSAISFPVDI